MSLRDRLAAWSPVPTYTVRELLPRERHRVTRFTSLEARLDEGALRVDVVEELPDRSARSTVHAAARFGAVLELIAHPSGGGVPQHGRQTLWTVQSAVSEVSADGLGRTSAGLLLTAPPLALLLGLVPADPGTEISLVRATWSELLVSDVEHGLTSRVPGTWTVFEARSRDALATAAR